MKIVTDKYVPSDEAESKTPMGRTVPKSPMRYNMGRFGAFVVSFGLFGLIPSAFLAESALPGPIALLLAVIPFVVAYFIGRKLISLMVLDNSHAATGIYDIPIIGGRFLPFFAIGRLLSFPRRHVRYHTITDEGISNHVAGKTQPLIPFNTLHRVAVTSKNYVVMLGLNRSFSIPRSVFRQDHIRQEFEDVLRQHDLLYVTTGAHKRAVSLGYDNWGISDGQVGVVIGALYFFIVLAMMA